MLECKGATYNNDLLIAIQHSVGIEKLRNVSILITGATGTLGSFLVDVLLKYNQQENANITIYAAGRNLVKLEELFGKVPDKNLIYVLHHLEQPIQFDFSVDYIIHTAGNANPNAFRENPVGTLMGIVLGTYNLLEFGRRVKIKRFLYVSTAEVYGEMVPSRFSTSENDSGYVNPLAFRSCYPSAKRVAETLCVSAMHQYQMDAVICRPCHTYGPCITSADNRAHAQFFKRALNRQDIVLKSAATQIRSYTYIGDCASALLTVLVNGKGAEAYNVANSSSIVSIADFARTIAQKAQIRVLFDTPSQIDLQSRCPISRQVLNVDKLKHLGWKESFSLEKGVAHTLQILQDWSSWL